MPTDFITSRDKQGLLLLLVFFTVNYSLAAPSSAFVVSPPDSCDFFVCLVPQIGQNSKFLLIFSPHDGQIILS